MRQISFRMVLVSLLALLVLAGCGSGGDEPTACLLYTSQYGDSGKRLWPTEFGWGSTPSPHPGYEYEGRISEAQQAQWITDAFRIMANSGYVGAAFLWNLNYNYGEMAAFSVAGRPAYQALKSLTGR